jgi:hypothetical protein
MGTRGRKSTASQATVVVGAFGQRPDPPKALNSEAAEVWRATVASEGAEFFRTAALRALLSDYCRHTVTSGIVSAQIDAFDANWLSDDHGLKRYDLLLKVRDRETKAAADKATKLRLTNQARYTPQAAATASNQASVAKKPWEYGT